MEKNVVQLNKIKWSIILKTNNNLSLFAQTLEKLLSSIDPKRAEIILLQDVENKLILETFSTFCEQYNIPYTYGDSYEHAIQLSKGMYLVFITDATLPSKNFLIKLTFCIENYDKEGGAMMVAPISNDTVPNLGLTPMNLDQVQAEISKQPKNNVPWHYTLKLSPFCLMIRRNYFDSEFVFTGFKDLILEVNENGYYTISANDTIVYHFPEQLDFEYKAEVLIPEPKLAAIYRVKIDEDYTRDIFVRSLEKTVDFADAIYVLDDNSKIKVSLFLREKHPELWSKITKYNKYSRPYDERRDYNELLDWAEEDGCSWALALEADEIVEDKVTKAFIRRFLLPTNPEVMAYRISHYHFWDSETNWRFDSPWGKMRDVRLARILPNRRITKEGIIAGMCGYTINTPAETIRDTSIRIKNYGYTKEELRQAKKEFYEKLGIKGALDFSHLTNKNGAHTYEWIENNTVSFYTPLNRGGKILYNWLDLNAYFADQVVLGNDSNTLGTDEISLCKTYSNVLTIPIIMGDDFGSARNKLLDQCTCDYIMQLDIDELLESQLDIRRMMDISSVDGWMFTIPNIQKDGNSIITETIRLFKNKDGVRYWGRLHETIDAHVKKFGWKLGKASTRITHFGYTLQSPDEAYKKMQKYLRINLQQMKENPMHGMCYYNVALHLIEDDLVDDAIKLLEISTALAPGFALAGIELGKCYIRKANQWLNRSLKVLGPNHFMAEGFTKLNETIERVTPKHYIIAKGHCLSYFNTNAKETDWLRKHILEMEKQIELLKTKQLEKRKSA